MKKNYQININPPPLSKKDIDKHKDFDALLQKLETAPTETAKPQVRPLRTKLYYWVGGIAATLLLGSLFMFNMDKKEVQPTIDGAAYVGVLPYVNPPIEKMTKAATVIKVNANEGGTYTFPSGSRMVVPKAAFANSYGAMIEGEVEIHFKEYHDFVDFFLSGIPMEIKVDGEDQVLESAGMIEVYATQNGEKLNMLPEKEIEIELKSQIAFAGDTPPDFNIYFLDEEKRNWELTGKDEIEVLDSEKTGLKSNTETAILTPQQAQADVAQKQKVTLEKIANKEAQLIAEIEKELPFPTKPQKPSAYDEEGMTFELDFLKPDLGAKNYKGTIWQVINEEKELNADIAKTVWEDYKLRKQSDDVYFLDLKTKDKQASLKVKPVLVGENYEEALQQFDAQLADFQKEKAKIEKERAARKAAIEERIALEKELANQSFEERMEALKEAGHVAYAMDEIIKRKIVNRFRITRFGTWNCDRPLPLYLANLDGTFSDQHANYYQQTIVYQADKSRNSLRRFYLNDMANIQFNKESDNLLWLLTPENKLAVFRPEDFNQISQQEGAFTFELDLQSQPVNSETDIRAVLKL
jgi:hypothetical protein